MADTHCSALRGATLCSNDSADLSRRAVELYDEVLRRNNLAESGVISLIFSVTDDLDAKNPAQCLREQHRAEGTALFVVREALFRGSPRGVLRLLAHCRLAEGQQPAHVYLNGAEVLRPDLNQC
ncbi:MAG: chorismate mutase [Treponema sp.]|jgi:chorismate mutase|nr:chorismate mutase [Treponema sp.]